VPEMPSACVLRFLNIRIDPSAARGARLELEQG
jgi:hypothetical protein